MKWYWDRPHCSDLFIARASLILPSAHITELVLAPTSHVVAPFILLHPEFTTGTLLVLSPPHKLYELLVILIEHSVDVELFASNPSVEEHFAFQAIYLVAERAGELTLSFIKAEHVLAPGGWTPGHILMVDIDIVLEGQLLILRHVLPVEILCDIRLDAVLLAPRAFQRELPLVDVLHEVSEHAFFVEWVLAGKKSQVS